MVVKKKKEKPKTPLEPKVLKDEQGRPTGIESPQGVFLGLSRNEVQQQAQAKGIPQEGGEQLTARQEEGRAILEQRGTLEDLGRPPQRPELDLEKQRRIENLPIIGSSLAASRETVDIIPTFQAELGGLLGSFLKVGDTPEKQTLIQNPETVRELALQEIQRQTIKEGISSDEKFGAMIEAIPAVGKLVSQYAGNLLSTPSSNVKTILSEMDSQRERLSVITERITTNKINPQTYLDEIEQMENRNAELEQRIKLLALTSAILQSDPDEVNRIEERILRAKERLIFAKDAASFALVTPATDASIFITLLEIKELLDKGEL